MTQAERSRASKQRQWGLYNLSDPKAAWRSYQPRSEVAKPTTAMDTEAMTVTMDADPLKQEQIDKARKTMSEIVARAGGGADTLADTLMMLGIHPDQKDDMVPLLAPITLPNGDNNPMLTKPRRKITQK